MSRHRLRTLSDDALFGMIGSSLVDALAGDEGESSAALVRIERAHRELAKRHRISAADGCTCRSCFVGYQPLEA